MPCLSAVIITQDNAATIGDTLASLGWCDEIVIVDAGSSDRTREICRERGARVLQRPFDGFGPQKNFAVSAATNDWVLVVDSDEIVTPELAREIQSLLADPPGSPAKVSSLASGYEIPISLVFLGRRLRFGGERAKPHLRLFNRRQGQFSSDQVHERVYVSGPVGRLQGEVWHVSYRDVAHYFDKFNRYTSLAAEQAFAHGRRIGRWRVFLRLPVTFCHLYFLRGLFLDGYAGFVWALLSSLYPVVKYMKLVELQQAETPQAELEQGQVQQAASRAGHTDS